jgi:phage gp45-like
MMTKERLRMLLLKADKIAFVEDAYSVQHVEDTADDDLMSAAEHGFMLGYVA